MKLPIINEILPPEILEKIFKLLYYKEICQAQLICRKWKKIIDTGNLLKKVLGKIRLPKSIETKSVDKKLCPLYLMHATFVLVKLRTSPSLVHPRSFM